MNELLTQYAEMPSTHRIDRYTPETIARMNPYDSYLLDSLALLRRGIWELGDIEDLDLVRGEQDGLQLQSVMKAGKRVTTIKSWEKMQQKDPTRKPFMLSGQTPKEDGPISVLEGRDYTFSETNEHAIFVNWVVVRNHGSNDTDQYTYRGTRENKGVRRREVARDLYVAVENMARRDGVTLLIAGVNQANLPSARFHEKLGFSKEASSGLKASDGRLLAHRTERGAFNPPYAFSGTGRNGQPVSGVIEFYTKRLG